MHDHSQGVWGSGNWRMPWERSFSLWTVTKCINAWEAPRTIFVHWYATNWYNMENPKCFTAVCQYLHVTSHETWLGYFLSHIYLNQVRMLNRLKIWFEKDHNDSKRLVFLSLSLQYYWSFLSFGQFSYFRVSVINFPCFSLAFLTLLFFFFFNRLFPLFVSLKFSKFSSWLYLVFSLL